MTFSAFVPPASAKEALCVVVEGGAGVCESSGFWYDAEAVGGLSAQKGLGHWGHYAEDNSLVSL